MLPLKRRKPLDEGRDTGTDLLERELERGMKIDTILRRPARARRHSASRRRRGLLVAKKHVTPRKKPR